MKIRTIMLPLHDQQHCDTFDAAVNESLAEGWRLTKREVLPGGPQTTHHFMHRVLYAELVLPDPPAEPEKPVAVNMYDHFMAIRGMCDKHEECYSCRYFKLCGTGAPHRWNMTAEVPGKE